LCAISFQDYVYIILYKMYYTKPLAASLSLRRGILRSAKENWPTTLRSTFRKYTLTRTYIPKPPRRMAPTTLRRRYHLGITGPPGVSSANSGACISRSVHLCSDLTRSFSASTFYFIVAILGRMGIRPFVSAYVQFA